MGHSLRQWVDEALRVPMSLSAWGLQQGPSWVLSCTCWTDTLRAAAAGVRVSLELVVATAASSDDASAVAAPSQTRTVLAQAFVNRPVVPVAELKTGDDDEGCIYMSGGGVVDAAQLRVLTTADFSARLRSGTIVLTSSWIDTPLSVCRQFVQQAALLSPTIAHDWLDAERCAEEAERVVTAQLPNVARWSSFEGRRVMNAFVCEAAPAASDAHQHAVETTAMTRGFWLPPLWPRVTPLMCATELIRRSVFRELVRSEFGLRHLPHAYLNTLGDSSLPVSAEMSNVAAGVFECDTDVVVEAKSVAVTPSTSIAEWKRLRVGEERYADVAEAARTHTPWALPLCEPLPSTSPTAVGAGADATSLPTAKSKSRFVTEGHGKALRTVNQRSLMSITDSLFSRGVRSATWNSSTRELLCFGLDPHQPLQRFAKLDSVDGLAVLLQFCYKSPIYVRCVLSAPPKLFLRKALSCMMAASACEPKKRRKLVTPSNERVTRGGTESDASTSPVDTSTLIAVLPLPFQAGTIRLQASSTVAREKEERFLLTLMQHYSKDPSVITPLLAVALPAQSTFFHTWGVTGPWLHPCGPLCVSLTRDEMTATSRSHDCDARPSCGILCIDIATEATTDSNDDHGTRSRRDGGSSSSSSSVATQNFASSGEVRPALPIQRRLRLPASGGAWIREAYSTIRGVLASLPPHRQVMISEEQPACRNSLPSYKGSTAQHLLDCATFTQLAQVALCVIVNDGQLRFPRLVSRLVFFLLGNSVEYVYHANGAHELRAQVTSNSFVTLASFDTKSAAAPQEKSMNLWRDALAEKFLYEAAPTVGDDIRAMQRLHDSLFPPCEVRRSFAQSRTLAFSWRTEATAESATLTGDKAASIPLKLRFIAQVREVASPSSAAPYPTDDASEGPVVFTASSESLARLVEKVLDDYWTPGFDTFDAARQVSLRTQSSPQPAECPFLTRAQHMLAALHDLRSVTACFDEATSCFFVLGWSRQPGGGKGDDDGPLTLAQEAATWNRLPQIVFRAHRQLLQRAGQPTKGRTMDGTSGMALSDMRAGLCATLGCRSEDILATSKWIFNMWYCTIRVPFSLLQLRHTGSAQPLTAAATTPATPLLPKPPEYFYVTVSNSIKKRAERAALLSLYHWTCCAIDAAVDYNELYGVECDVTPRCVDPLPNRATREGLTSRGPSSVRTPNHPLHSRSGTPAVVRIAPPPIPADGTTTAAKASLLDCAHASIRKLMGTVMNDTGGYVTLKLSQTFGLELMYGVAASPNDVSAQNGGYGDGAVQLLREPWIPGTWGPAQILQAETTVLSRLLRHKLHLSPGDGQQRRSDALAALLHERQLWSLNCGSDVSRRDFCVRFLRRYFGWRVCEEEDVADLPIDHTASGIVVYESVTTRLPTADASHSSLSGSSAARQGGSKRRRDEAQRQRVVRASLCLGQLASPGVSTVRLAQALADANDLDASTARELLWDACARRVKEVFGVSRLMTVAEVDAKMLQFMVDGRPWRDA
jgi:hypothetical protein